MTDYKPFDIDQIDNYYVITNNLIDYDELCKQGSGMFASENIFTYRIKDKQVAYELYEYLTITYKDGYVPRNDSYLDYIDSELNMLLEKDRELTKFKHCLNRANELNLDLSKSGNEYNLTYNKELVFLSDNLIYIDHFLLMIYHKNILTRHGYTIKMTIEK